MSETRAHILLIEDEKVDVDVVRRFLDLGGRQDFRLTHVSTLSEGLVLLEKGHFDLILLDLHLPDSVDGETLPQIKKTAAQIPIIVMTGLGDEEDGVRCVREGAQDYLVKGCFDAPLFVRVIRHTLERWQLLKELDVSRQKEQREREMRELFELSRQPALGQGKNPKLSETSPARLAEFIRRYESFLDKSVDNRFYKDMTPATLSELLRNFGQELSTLRAGPRDIVEIHSMALRHRMSAASEARSQAYMEEGRLLLTEVMGYVLNFYRSSILAGE